MNEGHINLLDDNQPPNSILITEANLSTGIVYKHKNFVENSIFWHKFKVFDTLNKPRDVVLYAILKQVHPLDLIPVNFQQSGQNSFFMARNCGPAIEKLCKDNLTVASLVENQKDTFKIHITLCFKTIMEFKIDVQNNIVAVLSSRFTPPTRALNLRGFHKVKELAEYCPLFQPKILYFVLLLAKSLQPQKIVLTGNDISVLSPLEALSGVNVTLLSLNKNCISDPKELAQLKVFPNLKEIRLDNNPFCEDLDAMSYIQLVREACPNVEILDGINIVSNGLPAIQNNFLCNKEAVDLLNQFTEYFFTSYDSHCRQNMEGLYHQNAMFSLTSMYHPSQITSSNARLKSYQVFGRNLKTMADYSRNSQYLFRGPTEIMKLFQELPPSDHDPYSFNIDLIFFTKSCAVFVVSGVFRELPDKVFDNERHLGFTRNFVLQCSNDEYCIVNEQLHVYNAFSAQSLQAFKLDKRVKTNSLPQAEDPKQKKQVTEAFMLITNLNFIWCDKLLLQTRYVLKDAISMFVDLYKLDKIPKEAFTS